MSLSLFSAMPFIEGSAEGLLFVAFSGQAEELPSALQRMAGHHQLDGLSDALLSITRSVENGFFYVPSLTELRLISNT